jgi:hypothetical protein
MQSRWSLPRFRIALRVTSCRVMTEGNEAKGSAKDTPPFDSERARKFHLNFGCFDGF